jgi:hypothetical protein
MKLLPLVVALLLSVAFSASALAGYTGQSKADCEKSGNKWDSKAKACYSANGY